MIHPSADVQSKHIGKGTQVWQYSIILAGAKIGSNCNINCHCFIENDVVIGDEVTVKVGVQLWDGTTVGNRVFIGPNVTFANDKHPRSRQYPETFARTLIDDGASIGANATLLPGIHIGAYSMIGAGAVVTKDVPDHTLWYGNPAQQHGYVCHQGHRLDSNRYCSDCNFQLNI